MAKKKNIKNNNTHDKASTDSEKEETSTTITTISSSPAAVEEELKFANLPIWVLHSTDADSKTKDIHVYNFTLSPPEGGVDLIKNADLTLVDGHRYGFVGKNGTGKSTLLKAIAEYKLEDFPRYVRVLIVEQETRGTVETVLNTVLKSDDLREALLYQEKYYHALQENEDPEVAEDAAYKLETVYEKLKEMNSFNAEARAMIILQGLGFTKEMTQMSTCELSGGWLMRVNLACALFVEPDLLLLDEPTNHLDFPTVLWLEDYLTQYKKTLIVVSHDRKFLDNVSTDIMFLHNKKLQYFKGNFNTFEKVRAETLRCDWKAYEKQTKERKEHQEFIDRFRNNIKQAAMVQARLKIMEKMEVLEAPDDERRFQFHFPVPCALRKEQLILLDKVSFYYNTRRGLNGKLIHEDGKAPEPLLSDVTLYVDIDSRIGMLGANGAGKSTLIKIITGVCEPTMGTMTKNESAIVACFTQHHVDQLDLTVNPMEYMIKLFPEERVDPLRAHLGRMGLHGNLALQVIGSLSGGQKSRVALAAITFKEPHLLILDEPTNHLDMETIDALINAVKEYKGGVIIVSHDLHFLSSVATSFWAVGQGKVKVFDEFDDAKEYSYTPIKKKAAEMNAETKALMEEKAGKGQDRKKVLEERKAFKQKKKDSEKDKIDAQKKEAAAKQTEIDNRLRKEAEDKLARLKIEADEEAALIAKQKELLEAAKKKKKDDDSDDDDFKKPVKPRATFAAFMMDDEEEEESESSTESEESESSESEPVFVKKNGKKVIPPKKSVAKAPAKKPVKKVETETESEETESSSDEEVVKKPVKKGSAPVKKVIAKKKVASSSEEESTSEDTEESSSEEEVKPKSKVVAKKLAPPTKGKKIESSSEEETSEESSSEEEVKKPVVKRVAAKPTPSKKKVVESSSEESSSEESEESSSSEESDDKDVKNTKKTVASNNNKNNKSNK